MGVSGALLAPKRHACGTEPAEHRQSLPLRTYCIPERATQDIQLQNIFTILLSGRAATLFRGSTCSLPFATGGLDTISDWRRSGVTTFLKGQGLVAKKNKGAERPDHLYIDLPDFIHRVLSAPLPYAAANTSQRPFSNCLSHSRLVQCTTVGCFAKAPCLTAQLCFNNGVLMQR